MNDAKQTLVKRIVDELVLEAKDDWVGLWEIVSILEGQSPDEATLREQTIEVVRALLDRGLVLGDSIYSADGFRPWPNQRPETVVKRICSEWLALGRIPTIGDIVYFDLPA